MFDSAVSESDSDFTGSDSDALSEASSTSQSASETYVEDIGTPINRDPDDAPYPVIARAAAERTYDSSSSSSGDDVDDDREDAVDVDVDVVSTVDVNIKNAFHKAVVKDNDDVSDDTSDGKDNSNDNEDNTTTNLNNNDGNKDEINVTEESKAVDKKSPVPNGRRLIYGPNRERVFALQRRLDTITKELAGLQVITASRAAEADVLKSFASDATSDGLLNGEVCRLRITLDHVTRLALKNAFDLRDQLEKSFNR